MKYLFISEVKKKLRFKPCSSIVPRILETRFKIPTWRYVFDILFISFMFFSIILRNNSCRLGSASMLTPWLPPRPKATLILKIPRYSFNSRYRVQNNLMPQSNEHSLIVIYNLIRNVLCLRCFPFIDRLELITKILSVYKTFLAVIDCGKG